MRKMFILCILVVELFLLSSCNKQINVQTKMYYSYFDTISTIYSYQNDSKDEFKTNCKTIESELKKYHEYFDIYHEYEGMNNLYTLNQKAGIEAVVIDNDLMTFLLYCKEAYTMTNGTLNVMLGSVLTLWHDARENTHVPPSTEVLTDANTHTSIDLLVLDETNHTAYISDSSARIDVGAIGKGYATQKVGEKLEALGVTGYALNIGGNIKMIGKKVDNTSWIVGIKNPLNLSSSIKELELSNTTIVTSGNYERYFEYEGKSYHHIIDPKTLMPATYFSSVTIVTEDSGLADLLSTALFISSLEEGEAMISKLSNVSVIWVNGSQIVKEVSK